MAELTHLNAQGEARMVDVSQKGDTEREAVAKGRVIMQPSTLKQIKNANLKKGNVISVARVAGIMAAKKTPELIPLCHTILVSDIAIDFDFSTEDSMEITAKVKSIGKTGAEMEAMVAATVAVLTIYDMAKSVDRAMTISGIYLERKQGGKSGSYQRK